VPAARHDPFARALRGAEALLPWPDVEALRARWSSLRDAMPAGVRHLAGRRFDERVSFDALAHGPMRARHLLATELELRTEGRAQLDTRTWTAIQRAQLQPHVAARAA
jgi:hypothetical protein